MTDQAQTSMQKAQYVTHKHVDKETSRHKVEITYKRLDGDNAGKEFTKSKFANLYTQEERDLLEKMAAGQVKEFCLTAVRNTYTTKNGDQGVAWNIDKISDVSNFKEKPKYNGWEKNKKGGGYDSLGNQVGNCITNAVNSLGEGKTVAEYEARAEEFMAMGDRIRAKAENKTPANAGSIWPAVPEEAKVGQPYPPVDLAKDIPWNV